jgi:hypothetical protein
MFIYVITNLIYPLEDGIQDSTHLRVHASWLLCNLEKDVESPFQECSSCVGVPDLVVT